MIIVDPYENPGPWGQIIFTGFGPLPGNLIGLKGLKREHEWVYQKGVGTSGASSIWRGEKIIEDIGVILAAPYKKDFDGLSLFIPFFVPAKGKRPITVGVKHPMFELVRVERVSLKSYGIEPGDNNNWLFGLGLTEYKPTIKAAVGPADPAKLPGDPKPKDATDKMIASLQADIAAAGKS